MVPYTTPVPIECLSLTIVPLPSNGRAHPLIFTMNHSLPKQARTSQNTTTKDLTHSSTVTQAPYLDPYLPHSETLSAVFSSESRHNSSGEGTVTSFIELNLPKSKTSTGIQSAQSLKDRAKRFSTSFKSIFKSAPENSAHPTTPPLSADNQVLPQPTSIAPSLPDSRQPPGILVSPERSHSRQNSSHSLQRKVRFSEDVLSISPDLIRGDSPRLPNIFRWSSGSVPSLPNISTGLEGVATRSCPASTPVRQQYYNLTYAELPPIEKDNHDDVPAPLRPLPSTPTSLDDSSRGSQELDAKVAREIRNLKKSIERAGKGWTARRYHNPQSTVQHSKGISDHQDVAQETNTDALDSQLHGITAIRNDSPVTMASQRGNQECAPLASTMNTGDKDDKDASGSAHPNADNNHDPISHSPGLSGDKRIVNKPPQSEDEAPSSLTPIQEDSAAEDLDEMSEYEAEADKASRRDEDYEEKRKVDSAYRPMSNAEAELSRITGGMEELRTTTDSFTVEGTARIPTPGLAHWAEASYEATTETARLVSTMRPTSRHMQVDISPAAAPSARPLGFGHDSTESTRPATKAVSVTSLRSSPSIASFEAPTIQRQQRRATKADKQNVRRPGAPQLPPLQLHQNLYKDSMEWSVLAASKPPTGPLPPTPRDPGWKQRPQARAQTEVAAQFWTPIRSRGPVRSSMALARLVEEELVRHQAEQQARPVATMGYAEVAALAQARREASGRDGTFALSTEEDVRRLVRHEMLGSGPLFETAPATPERLRRRALSAATAALEAQYGSGDSTGSGDYGHGATITATVDRPSW